MAGRVTSLRIAGLVILSSLWTPNGAFGSLKA